jgi:hypothetical protein
MSKKSKRQVRKTPGQANLEQVASNAVVSKQPSFNPDYSYVAKDLRRIGILAGSFVLILVVLSFFLR